VAYPTLRFSTPSGKIEFYAQRAAKMGLDPLPTCQTLPAPQGMLALAHGRTFAHFHGFYDHARALPTLAAREDAPDFWISPQDAADCGITDAAPITVSNAQGAFDARAKITPRIPKGTVWVRDGWPGLNVLTDITAVLPDTALDHFPFSVGQSGYGAYVSVAARKPAP
jgi:anaerobic selenocysteine-containing dehydrogenase